MRAETAPPSPRMSADFVRFWAGQTVSNLGSSITLFALPLLVFKLTGSPLNLGVTSATTFLPYLLFGLVIGAWVDRVDRKRLMVATDVARALLIALIPLLADAGLLRVWWLYGVAFLHSTLTIAFDSAEFAAVPSLVHSNDDLVTANGRIQASYNAAQVAGPLLAGVLITTISVQQVFWLDSASFLVSAASLLAVRRRFNIETSGAEGTSAGRERRPIRRDVADGLRYVLGHPVLRSISAMMAIINLIASTTYAQLVLFAKEWLSASDAQVGLLYSAGSIGIVALSLSAGWLRRRLPFSRVALGALVLDGLMVLAMSLTHWYWLALPLWAASMGLGILFNINTVSLRQQIVPNELLGRVISIAGVLAWSAIPLGTLLGGLAIQRTGNVALVYGVIGALVVLVALAFSFSPIGHAERYLDSEPAEQAA
ncbi:MAG TPA: MFS transporter [Actinomycetes bacterium]|nr:MFS transporter [Actinomycetes bacterium]